MGRVLPEWLQQGIWITAISNTGPDLAGSANEPGNFSHNLLMGLRLPLCCAVSSVCAVDSHLKMVSLSDYEALCLFFHGIVRWRHR